MNKLITVLLLSALPTLSMAQESKRNSPGKAVSAEFAKTANLAFVAIGNSGNTDPNHQDDIVQTAVNNADAVAISKSETGVMQAITLLSADRSLQLGILYYTRGPDLDARQQASHDRAVMGLQRVNECIASWRRALRKLSAATPKGCEEEQLFPSEPAN